MIESFLIPVSKSHNHNIEIIIDNISAEKSIPKIEILKELIYNLGSIDLLKLKLDELNIIINDHTRIVNDLFILANKEKGSYPIKIILDSDWSEIISYLVSVKYNDYYAVHKLLSDAEIELNDGSKLNNFSLEDSFNIISTYFNIDYHLVHDKWREGSHKQFEEYGPGNPQLSKAAMLLLKDNKIKNARIKKSMVYKSIFRHHLYLEPPWRIFDYPFGSMGWRMGAGESYLDEWYDFAAKLNQREIAFYIRKVNPPKDWAKWYKEQF